MRHILDAGNAGKVEEHRPLSCPKAHRCPLCDPQKAGMVRFQMDTWGSRS